MNFSTFALVGVIMLVLSGTSFVFLLRVRNKTESSWMLLWFFLCVCASAVATILTNSGTIWSDAFAPAQDGLLILGSIFLVRFAYSYPSDDQPGERRLFTIIFSVLSAVVLVYVTVFAILCIRYLPGELEESPAFYFITPLVLFTLIIIFFRRSQHCSAHMDDLRVISGNKKNVFQTFIHPLNEAAIALRNYGLALSVGLIPLVSILTEPILPPVVASYLFNFGVVAAIAFVMLVYLNHAPEPTTIAAKLAGISLVTILLILGLASVWFTLQLSGEQLHATVAAFMFLVLLSSLSIILLFPLFFRSTLLRPLERLSQGVKAADQGHLDIQIEVQFEDEIGLITHSFNRMVRSLDQAARASKNQSAILERKVAERTAELTYENHERMQAQERLNRQLGYERAVASCSESLLTIAGDEKSQKQVLTEALEHLRVGAQASRAYLFRNFEDAELGLCAAVQAEVCATGIRSQTENPFNQKAPWSQLPQEMYAALRAGKSIGGPVEDVLANSPGWVKIFLQQANPLLSMICFPIFIHDRWWGFIGFDDCITPRQWDQWEILMLRTASQIVEKTLQRWQAEEELHHMLAHLEERVQERTNELLQSNEELRNEIFWRERIQSELVGRLEVERTLARASAHLLGPQQFRSAVLEILPDIGSIMRSSRVVIVLLSTVSDYIIEDAIEWHEPGMSSLFDPADQKLKAARVDSIRQLETKKSTFIDDLLTLPEGVRSDIERYYHGHLNSLALTPILVENQLAALIACSNPKLSKKEIESNIRSLDVVAGMLGALMQREAVLNLLEARVADRTRELSAFFEMAMLAGEAVEISDVLQPALVKIIEISDSDAAFIHLYDEDEGEMVLNAQLGIAQEQLDQLQRIPFDQTVLTWIEKETSEDRGSGMQMLPAALQLRRFQASTHTPLLARGRIQGLLSCYRQLEMPFNPYQVTFLKAIGEQVAIAVENHRLRMKAQRMATLQERQRLARELHDAVSQSLYSLTLYARSGRDAFEAGDWDKLVDSLERLEKNALIALKEMRLLLYQLRSLALGEGGLEKAIEARFNLVERRSGIQASIDTGDGIHLTENIEQELFRLITEALNNALKHARADQIAVTLQSENERIILEVRDNGQGFDPEQVQVGMGLLNMRERASVLGGCFEVHSQMGNGTRIRIEIPGLRDTTEEGVHGK